MGLFGTRDKIDMVWFKQRFDELERQHAMIMRMVQDGGNLSPELEYQVLRAAQLSKAIDQKVPDVDPPEWKKQQRRNKKWL